MHDLARGAWILYVKKSNYIVSLSYLLIKWMGSGLVGG